MPSVNLIKLFSSSLTKMRNKQEEFILASLSCLIQYLRVRPEAKFLVVFYQLMNELEVSNVWDRYEFFGIVKKLGTSCE